MSIKYRYREHISGTPSRPKQKIYYTGYNKGSRFPIWLQLRRMRRNCYSGGRWTPLKRILTVLGALMFLIWGVKYLHQAIFTLSMSSRPLQMAIVEPVNTLEPALLENHSGQLIASAIYEGLFSYNDQEYDLKPVLAKSWEYADEGKTINIQLTKGIKFSNGQDLTAAAVKASWEKNLAQNKEWANTSMFLPIVGVSERIKGKNQDIAGIQAIDEHSLKIQLTQANAAFIYSLTSPVFWITSPVGDKASCGTGPFILKESQGETLTLLRNEAYHQGKPNLTAISVMRYKDENEALAAYKAGKADYLDALPLQEIAAIEADSHYKELFISKPVMEVYWLGFNLTREPYARNYLLRRALNYAIDRESIIKNILGGGFIPAKGVIPMGSKAFNPQMRGYTYDPDKARELLSEAGYPDGTGLRPLTLTYNQDPGHSLIVQEIARQLSLLGIAVQVQNHDWNYYTKQLSNRQISFFRLGWQADYPDADNFLYTLFHSSSAGGSNLTAYRNPEVDKNLDASRAEYNNEEERQKLLKRAEEIIVDDAPCLWLFQKKTTILTSPDVRDLRIDSMGMINWSELALSS